MTARNRQNALAMAIWSIPVAILIGFAPVANAQEWAGTSRARGEILTENDEPIADASVKLHWGENEDSGPAAMTTNKKGRWSVVGLRAGTWTVTVEAEGYIPWRSQMSVFGAGGAGDLDKINLREIPAEVKDAQRRERANELLAKGNTLNESGDHPAARVAFEEVLSELVGTERTTVIYAIANTYVLEENHEAAIERLNDAFAIEPDHVDSLRLMIAILAAEGRDSEAAPYLARLPEDAELDPQAEINLGISRYNDGNYDEAAAIFEKVLESNSEMPEALYFAGLVHINQQKNEQALAELTKFLEVAPDHPKAAEAREFLSYLGGSDGN